MGRKTTWAMARNYINTLLYKDVNRRSGVPSTWVVSVDFVLFLSPSSSIGKDLFLSPYLYKRFRTLSTNFPRAAIGLPQLEFLFVTGFVKYVPMDSFGNKLIILAAK